MSDTVLVALISASASVIAACAAVAATVVSVRGNRKVDAVAVNINGRIAQLLDAVGKEQHSAGMADGIEQERNRV